jgi:hypothetical protein
MLLAAVASLVVLAAGVAVLAMLATLGVHDALRHLHRDVLALDTVFAHVLGSEGHESRPTHGTVGFFLVAWAAVIALFVVLRIPSFQTLTDGSPIAVAFFFGLGLYVSLMLVFLPIFRLGAFGTRHDRLVPYWGAFFVAVFVTVVSLLVAIVI